MRVIHVGSILRDTDEAESLPIGSVVDIPSEPGNYFGEFIRVDNPDRFPWQRNGSNSPFVMHNAVVGARVVSIGPDDWRPIRGYLFTTRLPEGYVWKCRVGGCGYWASLEDNAWNHVKNTGHLLVEPGPIPGPPPPNPESAEIRMMRFIAALKCGACGGSGKYKNRNRGYDTVRIRSPEGKNMAPAKAIPCTKCGGTGKDPEAAKLLRDVGL